MAHRYPLASAPYTLGQTGLANRLFVPAHTPLRAAGLAVRLAGDCLAPRTALEAVYEGHAAARAL